MYAAEDSEGVIMWELLRCKAGVISTKLASVSIDGESKVKLESEYARHCF